MVDCSLRKDDEPERLNVPIFQFAYRWMVLVPSFPSTDPLPESNSGVAVISQAPDAIYKIKKGWTDQNPSILFLWPRGGEKSEDESAYTFD